MRSKSDAGTILDSINRDVGVSNKIFMDDAPNWTGCNIEMQIVTILEIMDICTVNPQSPW